MASSCQNATESLELMPAELKLQIILELDDLASLKALIHASPTFHAFYRTDRKGIWEKVARKGRWTKCLCCPSRRSRHLILKYNVEEEVKKLFGEAEEPEAAKRKGTAKKKDKKKGKGGRGGG